MNWRRKRRAIATTAKIANTMSKKTLILSALCTLGMVQNGTSFSINGPKAQSLKTAPKFEQIASFSPIPEIDESSNNPLAGAVASSLASIPLLYPSIVSATDDYEVVELPPVYVPILFAIGIIGGVGVLTASLGDVMDEGTCVFIGQNYAFNLMST